MTAFENTGMTRKIDDLGRLVLPVEIRRTFDLMENDLVEITVDQGRIVLRKVEQRCVFCGSDIDLGSFHEKQMCAVCLKQLAENYNAR